MLLRPILTSSGTLFFWRRVCELHRLFRTLSHFMTFIKLIRFEKKQQIGRTRGAPKKSVPEEAEVGHSSTAFFQLTLSWIILQTTRRQDKSVAKKRGSEERRKRGRKGTRRARSLLTQLHLPIARPWRKICYYRRCQNSGIIIVNSSYIFNTATIPGMGIRATDKKSIDR